MPQYITHHTPAQPEAATAPIRSIVPAAVERVLSPEVEDMLERTPSRFLRMGLFSIIAAIGLLLVMAICIRYPDTLEGKAILTTDPLPIRIKAQNGGRLLSVLVKEGQYVQEGAVLAEIENPVGLEKMKSLEMFCQAVKDCLAKDDRDSLSLLLREEFHLLGDLQPDYNKLLQQISAYLLLKGQHIYNKRINNLQTQHSRIASLSVVNEEESRLISEELKREEAFFEAKKQLFEEKVLSRQEFYAEAAALAQKKRTLEELKAAKIQSGITTGENDQQLLNITYEQKEREHELILSIEEQVRNLQSYIEDWRLKFLVTAPYKGRIYELRPLQRNEIVVAGDELYIVAPDDFRYTAYAFIPTASSGKVSVGQSVQLQLDQFPFNEYGFLEGKVSFISHTPQAGDKEVYRVLIRLPDSLYTSYHIKVRFSPEMSGTARIITKDKNLLQRLLDNVAKVGK